MNSSAGMSMIVEACSWTLVHSLWQASLWGGMALLGLRVIAARAASTRYGWCVVMLGGLTLHSAATFSSQIWRTLPSAGRVTATAPLTRSGLAVAMQSETVAVGLGESRGSRPVRYRAEWQRVIVVVWFLGQVAGALRIGGAMYWVHRWRLSGTALGGDLAQRTARFARQIGMACPQLLVAPGVKAAIAAGWFRPYILLPAAWLTEMPTDTLEAVIAHELAHLRRFDLWVNLLQRLIESMYFYHPIVWWLSRRIRLEREYCCDQVAVRLTKDRIRYARTLEHVARHFTGQRALLATNLGEDRMSLLQRIQRIVEFDSPVRQSFSGGGASALVLMVLGAVVLSGVELGLAREQTAAKDSPGTSAEVGPPDASQPTAASSSAEPSSASNGRQQSRQTAGGDDDLGGDGRFPGPYVIEPPDVLMLRGSAIPGEYLVQPSGDIALPTLGNVSVTGLTLLEAKKLLREKLAEHSMATDVSVDVTRQNSKVAYVISTSATGATNVARVGWTGELTASQAVGYTVGFAHMDEWDAEIERPRGRDGQPIGSPRHLVVTQLGVSPGQGDLHLWPGDRLHLKHRPAVRFPILGPITTGDQIGLIDPPSDHEVLRCADKLRDGSLLGRQIDGAKVTRKELITDYVDPPRHYPLIGIAQQHHAHYRYTVCMPIGKSAKDESATLSSMVTFYVDHNHLHIASRASVEQSDDDANGASEPRSSQAANRPIIAKCYFVETLVVPATAAQGQEAGKPDFQPLIDLIETTIAPDTWKRRGGRGQIEGFPTNLSIVVTQTQSVHEQIAMLLTQLRDLPQNVWPTPETNRDIWGVDGPGPRSRK